ncbi:hypothetical protein L484_011675 [Morus notabilis]|uniref:Uncharacterized protein n=1 Tax=Morus notabilis TaxID=981085 RepID=W9RF27_9ROSA|nr:hypothetical protein L484_011675 [Morus notabilis]
MPIFNNMSPSKDLQALVTVASIGVTQPCSGTYGCIFVAMEISFLGKPARWSDHRIKKLPYPSH